MGSTRATHVALPLFFFFFFLVRILGSNVTAGLTMSSSNGSGPGINLLDTNNDVLEARNTVRVDPLNDFKKYKGGYDITNKHYWSSTIFTGVYGYASGALWLVGGMLYGGYLLAIAHCCGSRRPGKLKKKSPCHKQCYLWPILLAIVFTVLAMTASGVVLGGTTRFHSRAKTVLNIIIDTANGASETIYNTTGAMKEIRNIFGASNGSTSIEASSFLGSTPEDLDEEAADIERLARKNRLLMDKGLKIVHIITIVTISLNVVAVIAISVCGTLRLRRALHWLIALCWLLTALCWLFFGVYFFLENFSKDTCKALQNFQEDPYNNSLTSILPCNELLSAKPILSTVSAEIYNLVNQVNANISASYPNFVQVCNPVSGPPDYQYQADNCPVNTIRMGNIPEILKSFNCSAPNGTCGNGQFISASEYRTMEAYSTSIQTLLNAYPGMESLVECQPVEEAFAVILSYHCKPLKRFAQMEWASLLCLSVIMVFLVLIWTVQDHHEQEHHFLGGSVKPHSSEIGNEADYGA